jgi:hypothetical protein
MRCPHSVGHNLQLNPAVNEYSLRVKHPHLYLQKLRIRGARLGALAAQWESRPWTIASGDAECGRRPFDEWVTARSRCDRATREKLILAISRGTPPTRQVPATERVAPISQAVKSGVAETGNGQMCRIRQMDVAAERPAGSADARAGAECGRVDKTTVGSKRPRLLGRPRPRLGSRAHEPIR